MLTPRTRRSSSASLELDSRRMERLGNGMRHSLFGLRADHPQPAGCQFSSWCCGEVRLARRQPLNSDTKCCQNHAQCSPNHAHPWAVRVCNSLISLNILVEAAGIEPTSLVMKSRAYVSMLAECCYLPKNRNNFVSGIGGQLP